MNIFLKNATSIISHREPCKPITKQELFDMLVSHDAFGGSLVLQHAVRDMISDGFWTEAKTSAKRKRLLRCLKAQEQNNG